MASTPVAEEPFLHHTNMREATGLHCFLDKDRPCSAECMAYIESPAGDDYQDKQWANCHLLVGVHRGGKHLVVLASIATELQRGARTAAADHARASQPTPPKVL